MEHFNQYTVGCYVTCLFKKDNKIIYEQYESLQNKLILTKLKQGNQAMLVNVAVLFTG